MSIKRKRRQTTCWMRSVEKLWWQYDISVTASPRC
jgi:hypothetical protein